MINFEGFLGFRIVFKQALVFPQMVNIRRTTKCIAQTHIKYDDTSESMVMESVGYRRMPRELNIL